MKKWRFPLAIIGPWLVAWVVAVLWMVVEPPKDAQIGWRLELQKELLAIDGLIRDLDSLLYSAHVDTQVLVLDDNTDNDMVQLGEISNRLANSSNNINEDIQQHREALEQIWEESAFPKRGLDVRLEVQYGQAVRYIDQYISYLSEIMQVYSGDDGSTDQVAMVENMASLMLELNKEAMRYHHTLELITSRVVLLQKEQLVQQGSWLTSRNPYKRLIFIILSNLFFLAVLLYFTLRIRYYSNNFSKLSADMVQQKKQNLQLTPLQNKVEKLENENQQLSQKLALTKLYHENLADNIRLGMLIVSGQQKLLSFNQSAAALLHLEAGQINQPLSDLPWWGFLDRSALLQETMVKAKKGDQSVRLETIILAFPQEEKRSLDFVVSPFVNETGKLQGALLLIDDVTMAQNMRHRLLESERLATVGRLAAQVAHEIRNPLSSISLNSELLGDEIGGNGDEAEARTLLASIQKEVGRLTEITERYLDLARPQKNRAQSLDLNKVIQDTIAFCARELQNNHIELQLKLSPKPLMITADVSQLRQAILNIERNSLEAMPGGGQLTISSRKNGHQAVLLISDSGPGVEPRLRNTIFDPFYTTKGQGTGLGLSITSQILKDNNAQIKYVELPGFGASFEIIFNL